MQHFRTCVRRQCLPFQMSSLTSCWSVDSKDLQTPCHSSGRQSPASNRGGSGSIPGQIKWHLWWTKWRCGRISQVILFPLPILIPPTAPYSSIIRDRTTGLKAAGNSVPTHSRHRRDDIEKIPAIIVNRTPIAQLEGKSYYGLSSLGSFTQFCSIFK
jgi:hypothetical protein